jgi:hypothetical protein
MGATPVVTGEVDELAAALEASRNPGSIKEDPDPALDEKVEAKDEKVEEKPAEKVEEKPEVKDDLLPVEEQNRELRQILRQQKRDMEVMRQKLNRVEKRSIEATKKVEEESDESALFGKETPKKEATPAQDDISPIEAVQHELAQIAKVKGPVLDTLLETMELSPKYPDVREVCSQANFDDIFEAIGQAVAEKEGKDASLAALEAEAAVWKMPNPYKYMYGLVKQYHPKFVGRQPKTEDDKAKPAGKKPADAPSSIANVPGKGAPTNSWTAARIDEMDEMELHKVPPEIYEKYLAGELE